MDMAPAMSNFDKAEIQLKALIVSVFWLPIACNFINLHLLLVLVLAWFARIMYLYATDR